MVIVSTEVPFKEISVEQATEEVVDIMGRTARMAVNPAEITLKILMPSEKSSQENLRRIIEQASKTGKLMLSSNMEFGRTALDDLEAQATFERVKPVSKGVEIVGELYEGKEVW
jgi:hypothetical protein